MAFARSSNAAHLDWSREPWEDKTGFIDWTDRTVFRQLPMREPDPGTFGTDKAFKP